LFTPSGLRTWTVLRPPPHLRADARAGEAGLSPRKEICNAHCHPSNAKTRETEISVSLDLDGTGDADIDTGIGFPGPHAGELCPPLHDRPEGTGHRRPACRLSPHHEDTAIVIGQAVKQALGDFSGITRFGSALIPMDEALTRVAIDISNRPYLIWHVKIPKPKLGEMDTELFKGMVPGLRPECRGVPGISKIFMRQQPTISSRPASRVWRGRCARQSRRMNVSMALRLPARARLAAVGDSFPVTETDRRAALEAAELSRPGNC